MKAVKFGKCLVVFGANWTTLPGSDSLEKEIRGAAKDAMANYYVAIAREGTRPIVGLVSAKQRRVKNYSAAALIALCERDVRNAVFGFRFEDGACAAICFVDGLPMVGYDVVGSPETVAAHIRDFVNTRGEDGKSIEFRGDASLFGRAVTPEDVQGFSFDDISFDEKEVKSALFVAASPPTVLVATLLVILIGGGVSYYAYDRYQQEELRKKQLQQVDPNIAYEANVANLLKNDGYGASRSINAMIPFVSRMPMFMGGWKFESAECQLTSCSITWANDPRVTSTFIGFREASPPDWSSSYKSDFQSVVSVVEMKVDVPKGIALENLPKSDDFLVQMGTQVQRMKPIGVDFQVRPAALFGVPNIPQGQPQITESVLRNPVREGSWGITGPWWVVEFVGSMPPNMTLMTMKVTSRNLNVSVQMEGKYYVGK